jgi:hypothetical protein
MRILLIWDCFVVWGYLPLRILRVILTFLALLAIVRSFLGLFCELMFLFDFLFVR